MEQVGLKCENFNCDAPYEDICCGECYKCVLKGCRVCKPLDQCVAEHAWNEDAPKRIVEKLEEQAKEPRYQHTGEDYYVGIESAIEIVIEEM